MAITSRECKFVMRPPNDAYIEDDLHIVKEIITYDDGKVEPRLSILKDFKRPFWITKPIYQNYKQKKESEFIERLDKFTATQKELPRAIAARLGSRYNGVKNMRDLIDSPYVYGIDVDSRAIVKKLYQEKYPNVTSEYSLAVLDIENDTETDEMVIVSVATKKEVYIGILSKILKGKIDPIKQLKYLFEKYIPQTEYNKDIVPKFDIFNTEIDLLRGILDKIHEYKTDFVAVWNIDFDIPYLVKVCKRNNVNPKDVFSHPDVPSKYKYFTYKQGTKLKVTESGVHKPLRPQEQWHLVYTPSYSYWIDAMSAYNFIRQGAKSISGGYSLDNVLNKELGKSMKKLKFEDSVSDSLVGIDWHRYMVKNKPLEYVIYNAWDTMSVLELDNKTKDLAISLPALSEISSFDIFNSGPKKIIDTIHYFYLDNGKVLGVKGKKVDESNLLGLDGWINILQSAYIADNYGKVILENNKMTTNIRGHVADLDAVSSYPSDILAANVSKDTTSRELLSIEGLTKDEFILENINLFFGCVNSVDYCVNMLDYPSLPELLERCKS